MYNSLRAQAQRKTGVYKRRQDYMKEIMANQGQASSKFRRARTKFSDAKQQSARAGQKINSFYKDGVQRTRHHKQSTRHFKRSNKISKRGYRPRSAKQQRRALYHRSRLHGWSHNDMNWRRKKADRENWRKEAKQATGLGRTSHRGQCSISPRTLSQGPSLSMTNQSLTAPIAYSREHKGFIRPQASFHL